MKVIKTHLKLMSRLVVELGMTRRILEQQALLTVALLKCVALDKGAAEFVEIADTSMSILKDINDEAGLAQDDGG